jgi:hypothetical protein
MIHGILTTARMRKLEYFQRTGQEPTTIRMHPRVWMDVREAAGHGEISYSPMFLSTVLFGLVVIEDPETPGIEMVVE